MTHSQWDPVPSRITFYILAHKMTETLNYYREGQHRVKSWQYRESLHPNIGSFLDVLFRIGMYSFRKRDVRLTRSSLRRLLSLTEDAAHFLKTRAEKQFPPTSSSYAQHAQVIVWVLTGPRKKNRPRWQSLVGIWMNTSTEVPGARVPLPGLKVTLFAKSTKEVHLRGPGLLALESTRA